MKDTFRKSMSKTLVGIVVSTIVLGNQVEDVQAKENGETLLRNAIYKNMKKDSVSKDIFVNDEKENVSELIRVIVEVEAPAAAEVAGNAKASGQQINVAKSAQLPVMGEVKKIIGTDIKNSFGNLVNGFSIEVRRGELEKIKNLPGVKNVTEVKKYYVDMNSAKELTQAENVWKDYGYQGEGMLISIIDTGIDHTHKDMRLDQDGKDKVKLSKSAVEEKIKTLGKGTYLSEKVPFGYNYADKNNTAKDSTDSMHGMHVAGIAAANGSDEEVKTGSAVDGVAPDAQLLAMKVFSNGPLSKSAFSDDIVAAIEDSVTLGADVINMSLGSSSGFMDSEDPQQIAIERATNAGVSVVVSAGNSQYSTAPNKFNSMTDIGIVGSPGVAKDTLQVANFENNKITLADTVYLKSGDTLLGKCGFTKAGVDVYSKLNGKEYDVVDCGRANDGSAFQGKDVKGKIALIERGDTSFDNKIANAQAAGAIGVIVYNNSRADEEAYMSMAVTIADNRNIPATFVRRSSGLKIVEAIKNGQNPKVSFKEEVISEANADAGDFDSSTSWGVTPSLDFKPEISAPGGDIYSTVNDNKYETMSGTSMAAPHATGGQALIIQGIKKNNPSIKGRDLSRLARFTAINTAEIKMDKHDPTTPYSPRRQGAGMMQIENAIKNNVILTYKKDGNAVTALKEIGKTTTFELELENLGDKPVTYDVESLGVLTDQSDSISSMHYVEKIDQASVKFDVNKVTVPAKGKAMVKATLDVADGVSTERFLEGFIKFNTSDAPDLVMPYIGYYGDWSKEEILNIPMWEASTKDHHLYLTDTDKRSLKSTVVTQVTEGDKVYNSYLGYDGATGKYNEPKIDKNTIAISPNGDKQGDVIIPSLYHLRNAKNTVVVVLDKDGKELGEVAKQSNIRKREYAKNPIRTTLMDLAWDGSIYNKSTGKNEILPEGQYTIDIRSSVDLPNAKPQSFIVPVKIDLTAPKVEIKDVTKVSGNTYKLQWTMEDIQSNLEVGGATIFVDGKEVAIDWKKVNVENGVYSYDLDLTSGALEITVGALDRAQNLGVASKKVMINLPPAKVTFETAATGEFVSDSAETYVIKGKLNRPVKEFTIGGENVVLKNDLSFAHEVKLKQGMNQIGVYIKDFDDKVIAEYAIKGECDTISPVINLDVANVDNDKNTLTIAPNQKKINIKGKVSDNTFGYKFYVNGDALINVSNSVAGIEYNERTFEKELDVKEGDIVQVKAVDLYGHETVKNLKVEIDNVAPAITISGVEDGKVYENSVTPEITVDDSKAVVELKLNGESYAKGTEIKKSGKYELQVSATDAVGNKSEKVVKFEIKEKAADNPGGANNGGTTSGGNTSTTTGGTSNGTVTAGIPQAGAAMGATNTIAVGTILSVIGGAIFTLFRRKQK
ncbi:S8 family serine peptidase [Clostridium tunisiense]|uniref:S8 family serine peptidase n=1 Tax=Clostridium tunisiense TaxID=219748 RepID=UPI0002D72F46|nr:S8 family serine peptidase [Clostridium tunisiense]